MSGGAFCFFVEPLYEALTPRWAIFLFGCLAGVLALVPFVAFYYGPRIRGRSKLSRQMMEEERREIERDHGVSRAVGGGDGEDGKGDGMDVELDGGDGCRDRGEGDGETKV